MRKKILSKRDFKEIKDFKNASLYSQYIDMLDNEEYFLEDINDSNRWFYLLQKNKKGLTDKEFIEFKDLSKKLSIKFLSKNDF